MYMQIAFPALITICFTINPNLTIIINGLSIKL